MIFIEEKKQLKDICQFIYGRPLPKPKRNKGKFPVYGSGGITDFHDDYLIKGPGIIVGRKGTIGSVYYSKQNFFPIDTVFYVEPFEGVELKFLYYKLQTLGLEKLNSDAAVPGLNRNDALSVELSLPSFTTQQRIASILSNYDDLIENNNRRIQILEEQAQSLYRHWFVDYKFPGHENVKMVDSGTEFGMIPEGWEVKSLGELVLNFDNKRKPLSSKVRQGFQGVYPYYGAAKIIDYVDGYLFDGKYLLFAEDGSVITEKGKPVLQYVNEKFRVSNHAHILQGKLISTDYLYIALSNIDIAPFITGVAQPKVNQANLNQITLLLAQKSILDSFDLFVGNIIEEIFVLKKQNINLKKQRDLLLPRLMSGEILVDDELCN